MSGKYAKFDSFLKRTLENREYKEVKIYEPCVVNSSREKHAFRFTFLTSNRIYITENPPKSLLHSVHLKHVVGVTLLHDKATFLQADLRDSVQHVMVKYISNTDGNAKTVNKTSLNDSAYSSYASTVSSQYQSQLSGQSALSSSSRENSAPILCSYSNLAQIESRSPQHSSQYMETKRESYVANPFNSLKSGAKWKAAARNSPDLSSEWTPKDPLTTHVLIPNPGENPGSSVCFEELHLYILNENTTFFLMLQSTWRNYIIYHSFEEENSSPPERHSTTHFDNDENSTKPSGIWADDSTRTLFSDLKQELQFASNVEHVYSLFNEMKTAVSREILIKFLFWKDDILFKLGANLIKKCIWDSSSSTIDERADEIEVAVLILQTMAIMLMETEAVPQCYRVLQNISQSSLKELVDSLLCGPKISSSSWQSDSGLAMLLSEYTVAATEVLYELIIASQQVSWVLNGKSPVFCTGNLFHVISQSQHLCTYLDHLMSACMRIWNSHSKTASKSSSFGSQSLVGQEPFSSENAIQVFHLFTVFHRLTTGSNVAAQHAKDHYKEEFKYYIHPSSVSVRFPSEFPISGMVRSVVHAVGSFVVGV